ncbi:hypothetical protein CMV_021310 [Castanea mollissima]|uniref:Uncharacterized protein n=1 Tax=Castanea mollissima TaxID=60419 RepID=A0A8J4QK76_9ROSI|nr:hypothetical protein CMV_021310 [Castanea mollissima]
MPKPFPYFPRFPLNGEEKLLLYLDVGGKIIYLLILIAMLFFALRKCKRNGGRRQTTLRFHGAASDDDGDTSSGEIAMTPTSLARHRQRHRSSASPTEIQKFRHQFTGDQHSLYHGTIGWALGLKVAVLGLTRSSLVQMVTRRR